MNLLGRFRAAVWCLLAMAMLGATQGAQAQGTCTAQQEQDFSDACAATGAYEAGLESSCVAEFGSHYVCGFYPWPSRVSHSGSMMACYVLWIRSPSGNEGGPSSEVRQTSTLSCSTPPTATDLPKNAGNACGPQGDCGNPINISTGNKHQLETDFVFGSAGLGIARTYNSQGSANVGFGPNWSYTFSRSIDYFGAFDQEHATVWRPDGKAQYFARADTSSPWVGDADARTTLAATSQDTSGNPTGWLLHTSAGLEIYDASGRLSSVVSAGGQSVALAYSCLSGDSGCVTPTPSSIALISGLLVSAVDSFGRSLAFVHDQDSRITSVTSSSGDVYGYGYESLDSLSNLSQVNFPDSNQRSYVYGESAMVSATPAANVSYRHALTGLIDESGVRYATWTYNQQGGASSSSHAGGVDLVELTAGASGTTVVDATATSRLYTYQTILGVTRNTSLDQSCNGCVAAIAYDANGNELSEDDFNGNRVCFAYDTSRNLRTVTLEGLPSSKACPTDLPGYSPAPVDSAHPERKSTTTWHPGWELKTQEASPKKITTWVYNGQPDPIAGTTASCVAPATTLPDGEPLAVLCARYEQATTDATGALGLSAAVTGATRAWTYTYNQYGEVLTETTPKQSSTDSLSHTTTYAYYTDTSMSGNVGHTIGDLYTVTNPLGQATTYTAYDGAGRLLSSTDANGVVTTQTYYPRGWLQTQTVTPASGAPLTTTYAYWPTGLLKTVTMPDASALNYIYDGAHRLTDVIDGAGNKLHYVLDNSGNRTSEQISDASGNLASTVARVYDALNRVQSMTGVMH